MFNIFNQDKEEKGFYWERNHQDNIVDLVVNIKDLSMIDVVCVNQIKIAYTEKYKPLKR